MHKLAQLDLNQIQQDALNCQSDACGGNNFTFTNIGEVITAATPYVFFIAGVLLLIYFIIAGYRLMFSGGDAKAMADAKAKMTYAIIGFIIVFTAFWIVQLVASFLGLDSILDVFRGPSGGIGGPGGGG